MKLLLMAAIALGLTGCEPLFQKHSERQIDGAEKKLKEGDFRGAVALFEEALDGAPKTADLHWKLGLIYDENLKQPISAMHHFQRYIELAPRGAHARDAAGFIKEDRLKMVAGSGNGATVPQEEAVRLKNDNFTLRKQVTELRAQLEMASRFRAAAVKSGGLKLPPEKQVQKDLIPGLRTYTVQPGDTLASISRKFYKGSSGRWKDIQDANFNTLEGTAKLKPGMVLMIP